MRVLGVEKRNVYVAIEFSLDETKTVVKFLEKAIPLYIHVQGSNHPEVVAYMENNVHQGLKRLIEEIKNGS